MIPEREPSRRINKEPAPTVLWTMSEHRLVLRNGVETLHGAISTFQSTIPLKIRVGE